MGGGRHPLGGHGPLTWALFGENVCKNKRIGSHRGRVLGIPPPPRSASALVSSLIVYKMNVLPSLPKNMVNRFHELITKFMWNQKQAKIYYSLLNLPKNLGGVKLVNLSVKKKSLKVGWIRVYYDCYEMRCLADYTLDNKMEAFIWETNYHEDDCIQKIHSARGYAMMGAAMLKRHQFVWSRWALYRLVVSTITWGSQAQPLY